MGEMIFQIGYAVTTFYPNNTMTHSSKSHRVHIPGLEINISYGCNLKCEYCTHLGRYMKGIVPLEELLHWYRTWSQKIYPHRIRILGGEPLLHPHLETVLHETRNYWKDSHIELITNGLLLPKMKPSVFTALKQAKTEVAVSKHFDDPNYNLIFESGITTLREHGIEPRISQSHWFWTKYYRINDQGRAVPFQNAPEKAWDA